MEALGGCALANRDILLRSASALPPFSPILTRLLATLAKENAQFPEVSGLIEKDTVLAGNLLRMVNSALYGMAGTVNSVQHALSIIGLERARNFVLTFSFARLWHREKAVPGWSPARFSLHSSATAVLADMVVQHVSAEYPEGAFTAGLFHDFGQLLLATSLPEEFCTVRSRWEQQNGDQELCEREIVGISHSELAATALERWNLPAAIVRAVRLHHGPEQGRGRLAPLSRIVCAANQCVNRLGITALEWHPEAGKAPEDVLESLGIAGLPARLLEDFTRELDLIRPFF
jgi:HD-like signal output (HDOD) protein